MKHKYAKALVKTTGKDGILTGAIGSTDTVDRYGEVIDQDSWQLEHFKKNPVLLWAHNLTFGEDRPPIGKLSSIKIKDGKMVFDAEFDMKDPFAADIYRKYKEGFLNAFSVGFIAHKIEISEDKTQPPVLKDNELLEMSAVPVPANPEALNQLKKRSFQVRDWKSMIDEVDKKGACQTKQAEKETSIEAGKGVQITKKDLDVLRNIHDTIKTSISDAVSEVLEKKPTEGKSGSSSDGPKNDKLDPDVRLVSVLRETTKRFQSELARVNARK